MKKLLFIFLLTTNWLMAQSNHPLESVLQKGHVKQVTCMSWSNDGKYIATGSYDHTIKIWNVSNGKEIRTIGHHTSSVKSVQFSEDGKWVLSAGADNRVILTEVISGDLLHEYKLEKDYLLKAVFGPGDSKIMAMNNRDSFWILESASGELAAQHKKSFEGTIDKSWFHPDGKKILEYNNYKTARIVGNGDTLALEFDKTSDVSFSPDGKQVAIGSSKLFAEIFDVESGKQLFHLVNDKDQRCDGCNTKVLYSHNSKYLLTGTTKTGLHLWNASTGKRIRDFDLKEAYVRHIAFSADDKYFLCSNDKEVFVYDVKTGSLVVKLSNDWLSKCRPIFSQDGKKLVIPGDYHTTEIWSLNSGKKWKTLSGYLNQEQLDGLDFSETSWTDESILRYINMKSIAKFSPDGKYFVKGSVDSTVALVEVETGKVDTYFEGHRKAVWCYDFSPDGKLLATGGGDRKVNIWNVETGEMIHSLIGHRELVFDLKFSSDGGLLVSGSWDGSMIIWDVQSGKEKKYIDLGNVSPYVLNFTPGDLYIVASDLGESVRYWEVDTGEEFRSIVGHSRILGSIDFSPGGKQMITAGWDGKAKIWDVLTGMSVQKMSQHRGKVTSAVWHPKKELVVTGGGDRLIHIWNPVTGKVHQTLSGHQGAVVSLDITNDGSRLISCSSDGEVKIWDLDSFIELYSYVRINRKDWLVKTPEGYFDGSPAALKLVNYVSGMEVVPIGSLFEKYYTPGLVKRRMSGEVFEDTGYDLEKAIRSAPQVNLTINSSDNGVIRGEQLKKVDWREQQLPLTVSVGGEKSNEYEVRIYQNRKLILQESLSNEINFRGGERTSKTFDIGLIDGNNEIKVVVVNTDRVESAPKIIDVQYDGEKALTDLYILSVGINEYKNSNYKLNFAVNDADAIHKTVKKGTKELFNQVYEYKIRDDEAIKSNLEKMVQTIQNEIGPEDVFLFYYAGHGVLNTAPSGKDEFFLVTHDVTNLYGDFETIQSKAISAEELLEYSKSVKAQKQLFVLDACQSGGAIESFAQRGAGREKALAQLARSTGTFFLTASQDAQYANEAGDLKHGLFTYAILEALSGKGNSGNDVKITVSEVKGYVEDRVPELSEQYHGSAQYPTSYSYGQDFPLVIIKE